MGSFGPGGMRAETAEVSVWKAVGGPRSDSQVLIEVAISAGLVVLQQGHYRLTKSGRRVATQDHRYGGTLLVSSLISAGTFHVQTRRLLESSTLDAATGSLICPRVRVMDAAPQLVGALRRFPDVDFGTVLRVPRQLVNALDDSWISAQPPTNRDRRKQLGNRGEEFSYRLERLSAMDRSLVRWVAQEDDALGYDIEDLNYSPARRIEVKASSSEDVRFYLSTNEWDEAQEDPSTYEIQFWGGVRLDAPPLAEFQRLTAAGYPIVYVNPAEAVRCGQLDLATSVYVVEASTGDLPAEDGAPAPPAGGGPAKPAP